MAGTLFQLVFLVAAPFWFLMIVLPTWKWTRPIVSSPLIALPAASIYVILLIPQVVTATTAVANPTLSSVMDLLTTPEGAALAWAHFIAFDLFVGAWQYRDGRDRGVHPLIMAPVLVLTILLAPLGFAVYLGIRYLARPQATEDKTLPSETSGPSK